MEETPGEDTFPNVNIDDAPMPSVQDLLKALEGMTGISDDEKASLRAQLTGGRTPSGSPVTYQMLTLISLLLVLACIFVFFGYKLYKSLAEKERKRDEKKRLKQLKKKK